MFDILGLKEKGGIPMPEAPATIAKEITLAIIARTNLGPQETAGDNAGEVFSTVLKHVNQAMEEAQKRQ